MKLQKKYLDIFYKVLRDTNLKLADARVRDSFLKVLAPLLETYETDKIKIYETYKESQEGNTYHFSVENSKEVQKEVTTLLEEEVDIEIPAKIKEFVEATDYTPKAGETPLIDEIIAKI